MTRPSHFTNERVDSAPEVQAPIFIVGTERSGSNLLRAILNRHPNIAIPHPPHIVRYFGPLESKYLASGDPGFERLVRDVLTLVRIHIHPWDEIPTIEEAVRGCAHRDLLGVYGWLYQWYAGRQGKPRWGCKSTFMIECVDAVRARFPDARFVWLVRDVRDVAASSKSSVFNPSNVVDLARLWVRQQRLGGQLSRSVSSDRWFRLSYENLVSRPHQALLALCTFLGEDFDPAMLRHFEDAAALRTAELSREWRNLARPVRTDSVGRYRRDLTELEIRAIEAEAGETMRQLGYATEVAGRPSTIERARLRASGWSSAIATEIRSVARDRNFGRRWNRAFFLWSRRLGAML